MPNHTLQRLRGLSTATSVSGLIFLFLKSSSFPFRFSLASRSVPQGAHFPLSCPVVSRSPAPIRAAPRGCAHDVVPDLGKGLGRNAPHLTDDSPAEPAAAPDCVPPCGQSELRWENPFVMWWRVKGSRGRLLRGSRFVLRAFHRPAQLGCGAAAGAPAPQVDGQLPGQGHGDFLFERRAVF